MFDKIERDGIYGMTYVYIHTNIHRSRGSLFDQCGARSGSPQLFIELRLLRHFTASYIAAPLHGAFVVRILDGVESKIETSVLGKTAVLGKIYAFIKILVGQKRGGKRLLCLTVVTLLTGQGRRQDF